MRNLAILLVISLLAVGLCAAEIEGQWNGVLDAMGMQLTLVVHVNKSDTGLAVTLDSPDQGAFDIPADDASFSDGTLEFSVGSIMASYKGTLKDGVIDGVFKQSGFEAPLLLSREKVEKKPLPKKIQEPEEPYPYLQEEVSFVNEKAGITLRGTLTIPEGKGPFPAVILVSGSGPQDRNEELFGHKPFLVLSDYLTRRGIMVLRYDDRGTAESEGDHSTAITQDFADDALAAVAYLKSHAQAAKVGIIGHSEGGIIAPIAATQDKDIAFLVLLAGPGVRGRELAIQQEADIKRSMGVDEEESATGEFDLKLIDLAFQDADHETKQKRLAELIARECEKDPKFGSGASEEQLQQAIEAQLFTPWMQNLLRLDPSEYLQKVTIPVFAVNGSLDTQVSASINLKAISDALTKAGNKDFTTKEYPKLNHLFQTCETGSPSEYPTLEETFNEEVMNDIVEWILNRK